MLPCLWALGHLRLLPGTGVFLSTAIPCNPSPREVSRDIIPRESCACDQVAAAGGSAASVSAAAAVGAVVVGHTTSIILLCSHFHQIEGDLAAGKMSPLVRLGPKRGMQVPGRVITSNRDP